MDIYTYDLIRFKGTNSKYDVRSVQEPKLTPLSGEELQGSTSNNSKETRVDIRTRAFWEQRKQAFFDIRVFDTNACHYCKNSLQQCHVMNEQEKKRAYNQRILQIGHGTFTPLVFSINGSMGRMCQKFYSCLAQMISKKRDLPQSVSSNWIRTKICFGLLKSSILCLRGREQYAEKHWNLKLTLMYLTLSSKYKLDNNHKTNIDTFDFISRKL